MREKIVDGTINLVIVSTIKQIVDLMTKLVGRQKLEQFRQRFKTTMT